MTGVIERIEEILGKLVAVPIIQDILLWLSAAKSVFDRAEPFVIIIGLFLIMKRFEKIRDSLAEIVTKLATLTQLTKAARETSEALSGTPEPQAGEPPVATNWETIRSGWTNVRDRIELFIELQSVKHKEKYSKIPRYSYRDVIVELRNDKLINSTTELALLSMNRLFLGLRRNPRSATDKQVAEFKGLADKVSGLPALAPPIEQEVSP